MSILRVYLEDGTFREIHGVTSVHLREETPPTDAEALREAAHIVGTYTQGRVEQTHARELAARLRQIADKVQP